MLSSSSSHARNSAARRVSIIMFRVFIIRVVVGYLYLDVMLLSSRRESCLVSSSVDWSSSSVSVICCVSLRLPYVSSTPSCSLDRSFCVNA